MTRIFGEGMADRRIRDGCRGEYCKSIRLVRLCPWPVRRARRLGSPPPTKWWGGVRGGGLLYVLVCPPPPTPPHGSQSLAGGGERRGRAHLTRINSKRW